AQLPTVARAVRGGVSRAYPPAHHSGQHSPHTSLGHSTWMPSVASMDRHGRPARLRRVVRPPENAASHALGPIAQVQRPTLAAEDEAQSAARRAWHDGMRRAVALVPRGEWGDRVLAAFNRAWQQQGGTLLAARRIDQPVQLARQIADLFQLRQSEARAQRLKEVLGIELAADPARRADVDFIFLAATPLQAQQIRPTLTFQYAGDVPVYATSHLYTGAREGAQLQDLNGIRFSETPWLLDERNPLRDQVSRQWPQASGSLGR